MAGEEGDEGNELNGLFSPGIAVITFSPFPYDEDDDDEDNPGGVALVAGRGGACALGLEKAGDDSEMVLIFATPPPLSLSFTASITDFCPIAELFVVEGSDVDLDGADGCSDLVVVVVVVSPLFPDNAPFDFVVDDFDDTCGDEILDLSDGDSEEIDASTLSANIRATVASENHSPQNTCPSYRR